VTAVTRGADRGHPASRLPGPVARRLTAVTVHTDRGHLAKGPCAPGGAAGGTGAQYRKSGNHSRVWACTSTMKRIASKVRCTATT